jgi:hypothetical protein
MTREIWPWQNVNKAVIKILFIERGFWIFLWAAGWDQNPVSVRDRTYLYEAENIIKSMTFVDCGAVSSDWKGAKKHLRGNPSGRKEIRHERFICFQLLHFNKASSLYRIPSSLFHTVKWLAFQMCLVCISSGTDTDTLRLHLLLHNPWESPTAQSNAVQFSLNRSSGIPVEHSMEIFDNLRLYCWFP